MCQCDNVTPVDVLKLTLVNSGSVANFYLSRFNFYFYSSRISVATLLLLKYTFKLLFTALTQKYMKTAISQKMRKNFSTKFCLFFQRIGLLSLSLLFLAVDVGYAEKLKLKEQILQLKKTLILSKYRNWVPATKRVFVADETICKSVRKRLLRKNSRRTFQTSKHASIN